MKSLSILAALTDFTALASTAAVEKQANLGVYHCTDKNFKVYWEHLTYPPGKCGTHLPTPSPRPYTIPFTNVKLILPTKS